MILKELLLTIVMTAVLSACATTEHQSLLPTPYSVKALYEDDLQSAQPTFVTIEGRLNLFVGGHPGTLIILRDLNDPVGLSTTFAEENEAQEVAQRLEQLGETDRVPYLYVSPLNAFYGQFPARSLYEIESALVDLLREHENRCIQITGLVRANSKHEDVRRLDFATVVPFNIRQCDE